MIELKPDLDNSFICPKCNASHPSVNDVRFESINILADCTCTQCGFGFFQVLPVGHMVDRSFAIGKTDGMMYRLTNREDWLSGALQRSHLEIRSDDVRIERMIFMEFDRVVILNALDSIYGHVLLKLYNAFYHLDNQKDVGLIVIVPRIFAWMIPKGCAEAWIVDLTLSELRFGYDAIRSFVSIQMSRFRRIHLSNAYSHPMVGQRDVFRLTGVMPFKLNLFYDRRPTFTFVLREDRWWFSAKLDYWFYRICRKFKLMPLGCKILSIGQNRLVKRTITAIKKTLPDSDFHIVGLGKTGRFTGYATDNRHTKIDSEVEAGWCRIYSISHVVIGIHGSNMLLPTAHAAGCVEVLPEDRYGNVVQDLSVRYENRFQLFFYRFVDQFAVPHSVASKAIAIVEDYRVFDAHMCQRAYRTYQ